MKIRIERFEASAGEEYELPADVTSYHQVVGVSFEEGSLWVCLLGPSDEAGGAPGATP